LTPSETFDIAEIFFEERTRQDKESWRQVRWQTMQLVNIAGKYAKRTIKETDLFRFSDEIVKIDPEERRRQALETAEFHAKMSPKQVGRDKNGKALIYGENN